MNITTLLNRVVILDSLASTSVKDGLSANRGKELFDGLQNKLDISSYNEYFKGVYLTFNALTTANPTAISGCYALVDAGVGDEADFYWYDADDGWVTSGGMVLANTDVLVEGSTNLYFTTARVRSSLLTGLSLVTNAAISAADSVLGALGKLQKQITDILTNQRYVFVSDAGTTYTVLASAVTANGNTIIELSNNSLTSITIDAATATGKTSGDSVTLSMTGTYGAQTLVADGVTINGTLAFSANAKIKTLIYRGSDVWTVLGG